MKAPILFLKLVLFAYKCYCVYFETIEDQYYSNNDVKLEVRLDGVNGQLAGIINVPRTGSSDRWSIQNTDISNLKGIHDVYFVFKGRRGTDELASFDYWMFK